MSKDERFICLSKTMKPLSKSQRKRLYIVHLPRLGGTTTLVKEMKGEQKDKKGKVWKLLDIEDVAGKLLKEKPELEKTLSEVASKHTVYYPAFANYLAVNYLDKDEKSNYVLFTHNISLAKFLEIPSAQIAVFVPGATYYREIFSHHLDLLSNEFKRATDTKELIDDFSSYESGFYESAIALFKEYTTAVKVYESMEQLKQELTNTFKWV